MNPDCLPPEKLVEEILKKERDRHDLSHIGAVKDLETVTEAVYRQVGPTADSFKTNFSASKASLLQAFYEIIDFPGFVQQCKENPTDHENLYLSIRKKLKETLQDKESKKPDAPLDKELKVRKTIAWCLSGQIYASFYDDFCKSENTFLNAKDLEMFFLKKIDSTYALSFHRFIKQLKNEDSDLWDSVADLLIKIAQIVTRQFSSSSFIREINGGEIVYESYLVLRDNITKGKVINDTTINDKDKFKDANHFKNHIYCICRYKCLEYREKAIIQRKRFPEIPLLDMKTIGGTCVADPDNKTEPVIRDIDINNKWEVGNLLAAVLLNPAHPLHQSLVGGDEDKVDLMMDIELNGLSYEQMIDEIGGHLAGIDRKKMYANLRQDNSRIKKKLLDKMVQILNNNGKLYSIKRKY